ncbi:hypothetical protein VOLCADRAFT_57138 [Volvox carteri f. nagariensis]|uniref:SOUL heme-binding protein n=1 Tax=Volvox carteri f. nagariensis TaxID=3068 RepID=D8TLU0_VOLCA|nr:uncharacterized protein VOLCADRAFT_57138 [Volvox carteri f. nagariensis]EFJ51522.1 hypothetical protein VOLCADRAFT_57138 [Volvox carteri f. nagariensis]|eukprot:XP_002947474.1 hypothetical protein VOLCADRAFT_57138 [Volvox carteri f. nagariensis]
MAPSKLSANGLQGKMAFLREDLKHLFDDKGIDASAYEAVVDFRDPITRYSSLSGYLFNIAFLRAAFDPRFTLHDMRPSLDEPYGITTRWTMSMRFTPAAVLPTRTYWNPTITFTGTSTYVFNPLSGKIFRHIDTWDSISNQEFFSVEGFIDFFKQLLSFYTTPDLETPEYAVLRRNRDYEVRRYQPYTTVSVNPAGPGFLGIGALARYIRGDNDQAAQLAITTPLLSDSRGRIRFVIGESDLKSFPSLPQSSNPSVSLVRQEGGVVAARTFGGFSTEEEAARQLDELRASLERDGLKPAGQTWTLARYNDPATPGPFRRNEVLLPLRDFDIWQ